MKKKVYTGSKRSLDKIEEYRKHFGWVTATRHDEVLTMTYDKKQSNRSTLRNLEVQADIINSKFPFRMIPWLTISIVFFVCYFLYDNGVIFGFDLKDVFSNMFNGNEMVVSICAGIISILLLIVAVINLFFAAYAVIVFFILKFTKFKTLDEIFRMADALSGNVIDAPLKGNIEEKKPNTGVLATLKIGSSYRKQ
jgi:hypothetical protein